MGSTTSCDSSCFRFLRREAEKSSYQAARSVHLWWRTSNADCQISQFCNAIQVKKSTPGTYFMACGFDGGYFGIQEMLDGSKRVLFSVWDKSSEMYQGKDDPRLVAPGDRVEILYQAPDVDVRRFGGEGTGAQCIDDAIGWQMDSVVRFAIECRQTSSGRSCYAAFVRSKPDVPWKHLATYRVAGGKPFRGFYSFIEDFRRDHVSTLCAREAVFGPAWFRSEGLAWQHSTETVFTASGASWERPDNIDTWMGPDPGTQVLATGGNRLDGASKLKTTVCLDPGAVEHLAGVPQAKIQENDDDEFQRLLATKPRFVRTPACPLCGGDVDCGSGPFCGGAVCEPVQCIYSDAINGRCVWPRGDGAVYCQHHASNGAHCPLCGEKSAATGPYCHGDGSCCGAAQCQQKSPFPSGGRCPFPCSNGPTCRLHV